MGTGACTIFAFHDGDSDAVPEALPDMGTDVRGDLAPYDENEMYGS